MEVLQEISTQASDQNLSVYLYTEPPEISETSSETSSNYTESDFINLLDYNSDELRDEIELICCELHQTCWGKNKRRRVD